MLNNTFRAAPARRMARSARGYTLIETLVATCVVAVLTSAGVPSLKGMMTSRVADSQIVDFTSALRHARTQAMGRGEEVTLCALADTLEESEPSCSSSGQDWSAGWVVFVDRGVRGRIDASDQVLRVQQRPAAAGRVTAAAAQRSITFQPTGISLKANTTVRFSPPGAAASDKTADGTKVVCINKPGKARVVAAANCTR